MKLTLSLLLCHGIEVYTEWLCAYICALSKINRNMRKITCFFVYAYMPIQVYVYSGLTAFVHFKCPLSKCTILQREHIHLLSYKRKRVRVQVYTHVYVCACICIDTLIYLAGKFLIRPFNEKSSSTYTQFYALGNERDYYYEAI